MIKELEQLELVTSDGYLEQLVYESIKSFEAYWTNRVDMAYGVTNIEFDVGIEVLVKSAIGTSIKFNLVSANFCPRNGIGWIHKGSFGVCELFVQLSGIYQKGATPQSMAVLLRTLHENLTKIIK